jgi:ABC-type molybdate transport system permease subunit
MGGASLSIIGKSLGHTQAATTMIYARLQVDSVRESVAAATTGMLAAGGVVIDVDSVKLLENKESE